MIIFHVLLRIIALLQTPRPDPEGVWLGSWKHGPWNTGSVWGMNTAYALAHCSQDYPRREWPGVKTRRSGLCQCSVLGQMDQKKFCSLPLGIKAGLRVDSEPQPNRGCWSATQCTRFRVLFSFSSLTPGPLGQHTTTWRNKLNKKVKDIWPKD